MDPTQSHELESLHSRTGLRHNSPEGYSTTLDDFATIRKHSATLYSGEHYEALAQVLKETKSQIPSTRPKADSARDASFVFVHQLSDSSSDNASRLHHNVAPISIADFENGVAEGILEKHRGNKIIVMRGYPEAELLSHVGARLKLDYEFLFQHIANPAQLNLSRMYCLPPLSPISTGTIQLTFASIAEWDNHRSGVTAERARKDFSKEMGLYIDDMNRGRGMSACDTFVRAFHLYDLDHFSIEQRLTIKLTRFAGHWTIIIWSDFGTSLSHSHRGPWRKIKDNHAESVRFLTWPLDYSNKDIRRLMKHSQVEDTMEPEKIAPPDPLQQCLSSLHTELGQTDDVNDMMISAVHPFYALSDIFRFLAASENQFLNLMEQKARAFAQDEKQGITAIQMIKKQVDGHGERLRDVMDIIEERGGRGWELTDTTHSTHHQDTVHVETNDLTPPQQHQQRLKRSPTRKSSMMTEVSSEDAERKKKADDSALCLYRTFNKLCRRAQSVSDGCRDDIAMLSSSAVVREAQRSMEQTSSLAKVTFIASVFVPLSFTTSIFGMNLQQLNASGPDMRVWAAVMTPIMVLSVVAWAVNGRMLRRCLSVFYERNENNDTSN